MTQMQRPKKTKGELWRKIEELEQKQRILDDFLYEKGLHEEACEYVMQRLEALEELPFE